MAKVLHSADQAGPSGWGQTNAGKGIRRSCHASIIRSMHFDLHDSEPMPEPDLLVEMGGAAAGT